MARKFLIILTLIAFLTLPSNAKLKFNISDEYGHKNEASNGVNVGRWLNWLTASVMRG